MLALISFFVHQEVPAFLFTVSFAICKSEREFFKELRIKILS